MFGEQNTQWRRIAVVFISILGVTGVLTSCNVLTPDDEGDRLSIPKKVEVYLDVEEGYANYSEISDPKLFLSMRTADIYGCCNYSILADVGLLNKKLRVDLRGIYKPDICLTSPGPATYRGKVDLSEGSYDLEICDPPTTDHYRLIVTESSIRLKPVFTEFTRAEHELVWRYPRNSFAYLCGTTEETSWIYEDFFHELLALSSITTYEFPTGGFVPYPEAGNGHWVDHSAKYFLYQAETDYEEVGALLKRYSQDTISQYLGVSVYLVNFRNQEFMSWQYTCRE